MKDEKDLFIERLCEENSVYRAAYRDLLADKRALEEKLYLAKKQLELAQRFSLWRGWKYSQEMHQ